MSYTPTEWHTGDTVTANKLNNLEQGVVDAQFPAYAYADKGKILSLVEDEEHTETVIIVPEQTVTIVDTEVSREVPLPDVDASLISNGDTVTFTVNGVPTTGIITDVSYGINGAESSFIYVNDGVVTFGDENSGDYVISLTKSVNSVYIGWVAIPAANGEDF